MKPIAAGSPPEWRVADLTSSSSWVFPIDERAQSDLIASVRKRYDPERPLLDYAREEFDLGAAEEPIAAAYAEATHGRGIAMIKRLPRGALSEKEFELLTWAIGLHSGVARPQGKASHDLSAVRNVGTDYRSTSGRGYSSNAELDFHGDGADLVALACYNTAKSGGMSMVTSSVTAHNVLAAERPDLAELLYMPFYFSRQAEQAPDEGPYYPNPIYDVEQGRLFSKWNRNRVNSAQRIEGVPQLTAPQREAMDMLDEVLRRPDLMFSMWLEPGDMQLLSNHVMLHSRTDFEDFEDPAFKRLLFRLWLAPPDSCRLPESWRPAYRSVEPGTVRGGIIGQEHDATRKAFERRQAAALSMPLP